MADPKIKYDIEAAVKGDVEVNKLAGEIEALGKTLEGDLKTQAVASAAALRELGAQNTAINSFIELKKQGRDAANGLLEAQLAAEKLGTELAQIENPTRQQAGQLQKLYDQIKLGTQAVDANKQSMAQARTTLDQYGISTTGLNATQDAMRAALARARDEAQKMVPALQGVAKQSADSKAAIADAAKVMDDSFRVLGVKSVQSLESELQKLQTALAQIRANADILPSDKRAAVAAFNTQVAKLKLEASGAGEGLKTLQTSTDTAGDAIKQAGTKVVAFAAALGGLGTIKSVASDVIETGAKFETLRVRLENLLGGTKQAAEAFDMIKKLAATTPFEVSALTESFVKLTAFGMQPTEAQMRSLSDVTANLGGGTEALSGITLALGQAWTKSKLQGQEIMQLAERGVPVWDALAQATGRTVPELTRMSEAGLLGRDVISKLIDELGRMNTGASDKLMNTYAGAVSNAKDALAEFYDMVSQSGVLDFLTRKIRNLLAEFERMKDTGELEQKAKAIADGFVTVASAVEQAAKVIAYLGPELLKLGEIMAAMKIASWAQSLYAMGAAAVSSAAGVATLGTASAATAVQLDVAAVAGTRVAGVLRLLRSLSGIGLVIGAIELAAGFLRAKNAAEEGDKAVEKMLRARPENGPKKAAQEAEEALARVPQKADDLSKSFDLMMAKGEKASEAIAKIGKDFDLSTVPGIRDAATVLDGLVGAGKISADQFSKTWADTLKGVDLKEFESRARQAFEGTNEGIFRLEGVLDVVLHESILRSGLDFDVISGGMSKASQSAIHDTEAIIAGLDRLKVMGVDTAQALTNSIGKGIQTADSQQALELVRQQIESVRQALGGKIADGLLEQTKTKANELADALDKAKPGINSVTEAMKALGVTSDQAFKDTAAKSAAAYEAMRSSGTASIHELQAGFIKYATDAIAANGGVATEALKVEAALAKVSIQTDQTGKDIVKSMEGAARSIKTTEDAYHQLGLKTPEELAKVAKANSDAWDKIKGDSSASVETLKAGFARYAQSAIAAIGGIDNAQYLETKAVLETEAAVASLSIKFDENGRIAVKSQNEAAGGFEKTAKAVDDVTTALMAQNAALERTISAQEKALDLAKRQKALDDAKNHVTADGWAADARGNKITGSAPTQLGAYEMAKQAGADEALALRLGNQYGIDPSARQVGPANGAQGYVKSWDPNGFAAAVNAGVLLQKQQVLANAAKAAAAGTSTPAAPNLPGKNYTVNLNFDGSSHEYSAKTDADAQALISVLQRAKLTSGL